MFGIEFLPKLLGGLSDESHIQRVFELYLKHQCDDLLGFGYHQYIQEGRGILMLSCRYQDIFFGKGFYPERCYLSRIGVVEGLLCQSGESLTSYDPETEILIGLQLQNDSVRHVTRLSKKGLSLSVLHRQYLNRLLDYVVNPGL